MIQNAFLIRELGFDIGLGLNDSPFTNVIGIFKEEEQEEKREAKENGRPVEHPLPPLSVGNESGHNWRKIIAASKGECVDAHVESSLMSKVLA